MAVKAIHTLGFNINFNDYDVSTCGQDGSDLQSFLNGLYPDFVEFRNTNIDNIRNNDNGIFRILE